jgi:hypothetical protein
MNLIDFLQSGGYRLKQATFRKIQESYFEILKAFVKHLDMPDVGNFIISGCTVVGPNITAGMLYIDGELCSFDQSSGTNATKIKKNIVITNLAFKNGNNLPVFRATNAIVDATGVALSEFTRIPTVKALVWSNISGIPANIVYDSNYIHTDNNFTAALKNKLDNIEAQAQKNVTPNWTENNPAVPGYIANKPVGSPLTYLHKGNYPFSDISDDANLTVTFSDVGTNNYIVLGSLVSIGPDWNEDNDILFTIKGKTATSFQLLLREVAERVQYSSFDYVLIPF